MNDLAARIYSTIHFFHLRAVDNSPCAIFCVWIFASFTCQMFLSSTAFTSATEYHCTAIRRTSRRINHGIFLGRALISSGYVTEYLTSSASSYARFDTALPPCASPFGLPRSKQAKVKPKRYARASTAAFSTKPHLLGSSPPLRRSQNLVNGECTRLRIPFCSQNAWALLLMTRKVNRGYSLHSSLRLIAAKHQL